MRRTTVVVFLALTVLAGCAREERRPPGASPEPTPVPKPVACTGTGVKTIKPGVLTVGSDIAFAPFESVNQQTQKPEGFDVDLVTEIARRNQLTAEFTNQTFSGIIAGLLARKFDVIASAMTITPERRAQICFSDPYIDSNQSLAVNVKRSPGIKSVDDLAGKVVAVQAGTTGEAWATRNLKGKVKEIKAYETAEEAFLDLKAGKVDGLINDIPVSLYRAKDDPDLEVVQEIRTDEQYGFAVHPENRGLLEAINRALRDLRADGTYARIYEKWFGKKPGA